MSERREGRLLVFSPERLSPDRKFCRSSLFARQPIYRRGFARGTVPLPCRAPIQRPGARLTGIPRRCSAPLPDRQGHLEIGAGDCRVIAGVRWQGDRSHAVIKNAQKDQRDILEARAGIEPACTDLQSAALPLSHRAAPPMLLYRSGRAAVKPRPGLADSRGPGGPDSPGRRGPIIRPRRPGPPG